MFKLLFFINLLKMQKKSIIIKEIEQSSKDCFPKTGIE